MAEVRVRLPLGALHKQDVGKPGIPRASGARDRRFKSGRPDCDCGGACVGTGRRLLSVTSQVRFLPPQLYGRASQLAMAAAPKAVELHSLEGSTPSPSACMCPWPIGSGTSLGHRRAALVGWTGGFDPRRALLLRVGSSAAERVSVKHRVVGSSPARSSVGHIAG